MTTDKSIYNNDGAVITPAESRRALREYHLQLQRANQADGWQRRCTKTPRGKRLQTEQHQLKMIHIKSIPIWDAFLNPITGVNHKTRPQSMIVAWTHHAAQPSKFFVGHIRKKLALPNAKICIIQRRQH